MNKQILKSLWLEQLADLQSERDQLIHRNISLREHLSRKEVTVIMGVRRSGKSSLLRELIRNLPRPNEVLYLSFDDPRLSDFTADQFELLYELWSEQIETLGDRKNSEARIAVFDEIQNVEHWERWINFFSEQKRIKVFITGSNSKLLSSELSTYLTGRHTDILLFPLSFKELVQDSLPQIFSKVQSDTPPTSSEFAKLQKLLLNYLDIGGFPRAWRERSSSILGEYYNDILHRDIVRRYRLKQPKLIEGFGRAVMSDVGRRLNKSKLATAIGIAETNTINNYFKYFAECYLGMEIRKFDTSVRRQLRNPVKFYAIDSCLARRVGIADESKSAFYLENLVLIELLRRGSTVYYFQEGDSPEVDFVVEDSERRRSLVQVCWSLESSRTTERELAGFEEFRRVFPKVKIHKQQIITVDNPLRAKLPKEIEAQPFSTWALESR